MLRLPNFTPPVWRNPFEWGIPLYEDIQREQQRCKVNGELTQCIGEELKLLHQTMINNPQYATPRAGETPLFRSVRYRIKSLREPQERDNRSVLATHEKSSLERSFKQEESSEFGNTLQRGFSMNGPVRIRRNDPTIFENTMHKTSKNWSYLMPRKRQQPNKSYMDSVNQILSVRKTAKADIEDWKNKSRIQLPSIEDFQFDTQFTVLDPIRLQINFVQGLIDQTRQNVREVHQHLKETAELMKPIQPKITTILQNIEKSVLSKLNSFRMMLSNDSVRHQQSQIRYKPVLSGLQTQLQEYKTDFDKTLNHIQDLQQVVFKTTPFELVEDPSYGLPQFQQKLF